MIAVAFTPSALARFRKTISVGMFSPYSRLER
jgi:hypothetical protein